MFEEDRKQVEYIGIMCGEHRVCMPCIQWLVRDAINDKERKMSYYKKGGM